MEGGCNSEPGFSKKSHWRLNAKCKPVVVFDSQCHLCWLKITPTCSNRLRKAMNTSAVSDVTTSATLWVFRLWSLADI